MTDLAVRRHDDGAQGMAGMLAGTLVDFTLPDVLHLLALTRKSGRLEVVRREGRGRIWFAAGDVAFATADAGRAGLGRRLVGAGLVTTERLREALAAERGPDPLGPRFGRSLVERGALDRATLESVMREQIQDAVFDLMRWTAGTFRFGADDQDVAADDSGPRCAVDDLVAEGARRLEEWEAFESGVGGPGAVVAMARAHGADSGVSLRPDQWNLLSLVDGHRTVADVVRLLGQGEYATCRILHGMIEADLLEIRDPQTGGQSAITALLEQHALLSDLEEGHIAPADLADAGTMLRAVAAAALVDDATDVPAAADVSVASDMFVTPVAADASDVPGPSGGRLVADPDIDADLVRRLIDGVKGL